MGSLFPIGILLFYEHEFFPNSIQGLIPIDCNSSSFSKFTHLMIKVTRNLLSWSTPCLMTWKPKSTLKYLCRWKMSSFDLKMGNIVQNSQTFSGLFIELMLLWIECQHQFKFGLGTSVGTSDGAKNDTLSKSISLSYKYIDDNSRNSFKCLNFCWKIKLAK